MQREPIVDYGRDVAIGVPNSKAIESTELKHLVAERVDDGDSVAIIGENHKLVIFPLDNLPEMTRGRGVKLQSYKDGGLADAKAFLFEEGLTWKSGDRTRTETDLLAWVGKRAQAGRLAPKGFPRSNNFG